MKCVAGRMLFLKAFKRLLEGKTEYFLLMRMQIFWLFVLDFWKYLKYI